MKTLIYSTVQIISGILTAFSSWQLTLVKAGVQITNPHYVYSPPPNSIFEFVLVGLGLVISVCSFLQVREHVKFAVWQMVFGILITIVATPLGIRAATLHHGEVSVIYYIFYLLVGVGLDVSFIGVVQIIRMFIYRSKI
jgi:hypothetical protein